MLSYEDQKWKRGTPYVHNYGMIGVGFYNTSNKNLTKHSNSFFNYPCKTHF